MIVLVACSNDGVAVVAANVRRQPVNVDDD